MRPRFEDLEGRTLLAGDALTPAASEFSVVALIGEPPPTAEVALGHDAGLKAWAAVQGQAMLEVSEAGGQAIELSLTVPADALPGLTQSTAWEATRIERQATPLAAPPEVGTIALERPGPHDTQGSAQWLPGSLPLTMIGSIRLGEGPDVYAIDPAASAYRLVFRALNPSSNLADCLTVFDGDAALITGWTVSRTQNTLTIEIRATGAAAEAFYVQVGPSGQEAGVSQEWYALSVLPLEPGTETPYEPSPTGSPPPATTFPGKSPTSNPGQGAGGTVQIPLPEPWPWAGGETTVPTGRGPEEIGDEAAVVPIEVNRVVPGPLPARAAAPFGGILAFGDPVPEVGAHEAAVIDLALIDLPRLAGDELAFRDPSGEAGDEAAALVAVDGPDGLPRLAAAHPRLTGAGLPELPLDPAVPALAAPTVVVPAGDAAPVPMASTVSGAAPAEAAEPPATRRVLRWTVAGLTTLMAAHLMLPDLGGLLPMVRSSGRGRRGRLGLLVGGPRPPRLPG